MSSRSDIPSSRPLDLAQLDYSVLQQCMHCGMCLPTCPTYDATKMERNSPRGRIALMRAIADERLGVTREFGEEMYFCLGCLACETACPAGVDYTRMFEAARADIENAGVLATAKRSTVRAVALRLIFTRPWLLRAVGRALRWYQASGLESLVRRCGLTRLLPRDLRGLEPLTPRMQRDFSDTLIGAVEEPWEPPRWRVGLLTGCVQDLAYSHVNRDTADVLLANGCAVVTPGAQPCCGSLHAHNGELEWAREMARRTMDAFDLDALNAVITNAAGCGSHLKHYDALLADDPRYAAKARAWSAKVRDIHEWLSECGMRKVECGKEKERVTYHEACHLCHGQKISKAPREVLAAAGVELVELPEATWCCGSAGIYNITQPEMSARLLARKVACIAQTGAGVVAAANPGCCVQLEAGARMDGSNVEVVHPVTLLARAYRAEALQGVGPSGPADPASGRDAPAP
jgi:glycolate oxidase iron-sulfur subunit